MDPALVIGIDAGGTSTRCVLASSDGTIVARGQAGGANPRSSGVLPDGPLSGPLSGALGQALSGVDRQRVAYGVVGVAGAGAAGWQVAHDATVTAWRAAGLTAPVVTLTDLEVAFSAGTPSASGLLLVAGTGAVSAAFREHRVVHRCDGYGWLLGDEGSAVWIGLRGLRRVLAALDGRAPATALTAPVTDFLVGTASGRPAGIPFPARPDGPAPPAAALDACAPRSGGSGGAHAQALIAAAYGLPPAGLGRLAPLVCAAATAGDPAAAAIVGSAVDRLLDALLTVASQSGLRRPDDDPPRGKASQDWDEPAGRQTPQGRDEPAGRQAPQRRNQPAGRKAPRHVDDPPHRGGPPVVLAGSVLLAPGPVDDGVRAGVRERLGVEPLQARDGAAGAAAIALRLLSGRPLPAPTHARLVSAIS